MEIVNLRFFIQVKDGQPFQHPITYDNFVQAFPDIDPDNLPVDRFANFVRVRMPRLSPYEILESAIPTYEWVGDVVKDVWKTRPMTEEEKVAEQQKVKDAWAARPQVENWSAWAFNESTCNYEPPIPRPKPDYDKLKLGIQTFWSGADNNWKDTPPLPGPLNKYKFDFLAWDWVEVTL